MKNIIVSHALLLKQIQALDAVIDDAPEDKAELLEGLADFLKDFKAGHDVNVILE